MSDATGIARTTIARGIRELELTNDRSDRRQRREVQGVRDLTKMIRNWSPRWTESSSPTAAAIQ